MTSPTSPMVGWSEDLGSVARAFGLLASRAIPTRLRSEGAWLGALLIAAAPLLSACDDHVPRDRHSEAEGFLHARGYTGVAVRVTDGDWKMDKAVCGPDAVLLAFSSDQGAGLVCSSFTEQRMVAATLKASQHSPDTREGSKAEGHGRPNQDSPIPTQGQQP